MNAASPDLCAQLEKVSGWRATDDQLVWAYFGKTEPVLMLKRELYRTNGTINPDVKVVTAFDLGWLMRELPESIDDFYSLHISKETAEYSDLSEMTGHDTKLVVDGDTSENILAHLALTLFEQGVLKWSVPS